MDLSYLIWDDIEHVEHHIAQIQEGYIKQLWGFESEDRTLDEWAFHNRIKVRFHGL